MTVADLKHLHPDDVVLWLHVEAAVWRLAKASHSPLEVLRPTPRQDVSREAGAWIDEEGTMEIALRKKWKAGVWGPLQPLHYLIDTIAHEMAHAKLGHREHPTHSPLFTRTHGKMLILAEDLKLRLDILRSGVTFPA